MFYHRGTEDTESIRRLKLCALCGEKIYPIAIINNNQHRILLFILTKARPN